MDDRERQTDNKLAGSSLHQWSDDIHKSLAFLADLRDQLSKGEAINLSEFDSKVQVLNTTVANLQERAFDLEQLTHDLTYSNAHILDLKYLAEQAEAKAVECDSGKTRFLARISHEIRSPLSVIIGYADQILEDDLDFQECKKVAQTIKSSGDFVLDVINEVLDFSKIEAGALTLSNQETSLVLIVLQTFSLFKQTAASRDIEFHLRMHFPLPEIINIDGHRFKQVLVNLCSNALKFTEKGNVILDVSYYGGAVKVQIMDTGIGMTQEQLEKIFKPFTQAESSISSRFGGTGLGLCIAYEIIEKMGGKLSVASECGQGSCFTVILPLKQPPKHFVNDYEECQHFVENIQKPVSDLKGRVIVAEDTRDLQMIIGAVLEKAGLDVVLVSNGQQAFEAFKRKEADLVLLDIEMPVLDGVSAFKAMRAFEKMKDRKPVPILALTGHAFKDEVNRLLDIGFNQVVIKPFQRQALLKALHKALYDD